MLLLMILVVFTNDHSAARDGSLLGWLLLLLRLDAASSASSSDSVDRCRRRAACDAHGWTLYRHHVRSVGVTSAWSEGRWTGSGRRLLEPSSTDVTLRDAEKIWNHTDVHKDE